MLIQRKLAQCSWQGKPHEFDKFWPLPERYRTPALVFDIKSPEYREWWNKIRERNKRK